MNPADILSRGGLISQLQSNEFWFKGPIEITLSPELDFKKFSLMHENLIDTTTLSIVHSEGKEENIPSYINGRLVNIMEIERFNSFTKLIRITAYVIRFIRNLEKKIQGDHLFLNVLRVDEISYAEHSKRCLFK